MTTTEQAKMGSHSNAELSKDGAGFQTAMPKPAQSDRVLNTFEGMNSHVKVTRVGGRPVDPWNQHAWPMND